MVAALNADLSGLGTRQALLGRLARQALEAEVAP